MITGKENINFYFHFRKLVTPVTKPAMFFIIFCLMLLPANMTGYVTNIANADSQEEYEDITMQDGLSETEQPAETLTQQLFQEDISTLEQAQNPESQIELLSLIRQIRSIEFPYEESPSIEITVEQDIQPADQNAVIAATPEPEAADANQIIQPKGNISAETLEILTNILDEQQDLANPGELAEILYLDGKLEQAAKLYQIAITQSSVNNIETQTKRPWFLFQAANCLRNYDITQAGDLFSRLINEYPDSEWTEMAKVQYEILQWYQQENPEKLISENRQ